MFLSSACLEEWPSDTCPSLNTRTKPLMILLLLDALKRPVLRGEGRASYTGSHPVCFGLREHGNALALHVAQRVFSGENVSLGASGDGEVECVDQLGELYWLDRAARTIQRGVAAGKLERLLGRLVML
uniref:AlNc14C66G4681 protein n=1 Tax=Albugo laibachii Nc14 TaxID=890382 RepID=F0WDG1_9STRA|nr:AlNc14C66G4681 [Albugo laibachii Nc14]|eukprot:CCA19233.1 AlNc14C66G4681 [Albugo laibachii Nc14]